MKAEQDLFLTRERDRVVPGGTKEAAYLIAREGAEIPQAVAERHGIVDGKVPESQPTPDMSEPRNNVEPEGEAPRRGPGRPSKTRDA